MNFQPDAPSKAAHARSGVRPSRKAAEEAVRTLILWAGDNLSRERLEGTPDRVVYLTRNFTQAISKTPKQFCAPPLRKPKATTKRSS